MKHDLLTRQACDSTAYVVELVAKVLEGDDQDLVRISIGLGIIEAALTSKTDQCRPESFPVSFCGHHAPTLLKFAC